jgi:hypothetical protein
MNNSVKIYQPSKSAMQSGRLLSKKWILKFSSDESLKRDGLMGWNGSSDTDAQVKLSFSSKEDAINYVEKMGLDYTVIEPKKRSIKSKSYASNFSYKPLPS